MRLLKIMLIILVSGMLVAPLLSCGSESDEAKLTESVVTVQRGNLTVDITAAGNLALSRTEDLVFDLFYGQSGTSGTKGTVGEVLVEEGDTVEEGQVLVTVDKDEWEDELEELEDAVTTAERQLTTEERDLTQAQVNLLTANQSLKTSQDNEATKELAVLNAQISLETAKDNLADAIKTYGWAQFEPIEAELNRAKAWYERVKDAVSHDTSDLDDSLLILERAEERLDTAQADYDNFLAGHGNEKIDLKKKQVEAAEMSLASAQEDLADVAEDVAIKEQQVRLNEGKLEDAQIDIEDALKDVEDAQEALEEAQSKSPEVTAPFAGFITSVNVEGGDEVLKGTVAVQIADPNKFEANILVSEMDILQVKIGGEAWVQVDALPGMSLPAKVTHIAPTATIQSGVVNYEVKVEIESQEAAVTERQEAKQEAMAGIAAGELPERLQQAIEEGRITREQVEEMIKQGPPPGMGSASGQEIPSTGQGAAAIPEDFQLREGLTVTVSIIVAQKTDVLLVPNAAVTTEGTENYVQVVSPDGTMQKRTIQTGISDYQFTEVTEGLSEGEQVIVPQGTSTTPTTSQQEPPRMGLFGPRPR
jgi:HlyD family secretion protein